MSDTTRDDAIGIEEIRALVRAHDIQHLGDTRVGKALRAFLATFDRPRPGQALFMWLGEIDPDFAESIRGTAADPHHRDAAGPVALSAWMVRLLGAQQTYRAALTRRFLRGTTEGPWRAMVQGGVQNPEAFCVVGSEPKVPVAMDMTRADAHAVVALFNAAHVPPLQRRAVAAVGPYVGWAEFRARLIAKVPPRVLRGSLVAKLHRIASAMSGAAAAYELAAASDTIDETNGDRCAALLGDVVTWLVLAEHATECRSSFDTARDPYPLVVSLAVRVADFAGCIAHAEMTDEIPWTRARKSLEAVACEIARRAAELGGLEAVCAAGASKKGGV